MKGRTRFCEKGKNNGDTRKGKKKWREVEEKKEFRSEV
jgi:hypothetical protein